MTNNEFAKLLKLHSNDQSALTFETAREWLHKALKRLIPDQVPLELSGKTRTYGASVLAWDEYGIVLQDSKGLLYSIRTDSCDELCIDQDFGEIFNLLWNEAKLDKVLNPIAIEEYRKLQEKAVNESMEETKKKLPCFRDWAP